VDDIWNDLPTPEGPAQEELFREYLAQERDELRRVFRGLDHVECTGQKYVRLGQMTKGDLQEAIRFRRRRLARLQRRGETAAMPHQLTRSGSRRGRAWLRGVQVQKVDRPPLNQTLIDVAWQIADLIERGPSFGLADARRRNDEGWTVQLLTLGTLCKHETRNGVTLADEELRQAMRLARRIRSFRRNDFS